MRIRIFFLIGEIFFTKTREKMRNLKPSTTLKVTVKWAPCFPWWLYERFCNHKVASTYPHWPK